MMVLARLMSILQGLSGASEAAISRMLALLASPFAPRVPARGTVGASGDLTPLAHMVLALQGQGGFIDSAGAPVDRATALDALGGPLDLRARDGLALVNGTSAMTGVAVLNVCAMARAQSRALAQSAVLAEVFGARMEAWHPLFAQVRPHAGQLWACEQLSALTLDAPRVAREFVALRVLSGAAGAEPAALQDAYSLRCVPQLVGAAYDTAAFHQRVVECELSSVTDNPIFPDPALAPPAPALHGGNFMGMHVGLASDALAGAVLTLANLAERQIARLTDERLNAGLPAFLHDGPCGLNSGFMGAQVTASALLAEMRAIGPAAIQSISTNGANQDVVSMGTIAARLARDKLALLARIQAILAMCLAQAMELRARQTPELGWSAAALALQAQVRALSAPLSRDRPLGAEIDLLAERFFAPESAENLSSPE